MDDCVDCFICIKTLSEGEVITVKKKRIQTLIKASVTRGNEEHERMLTPLSSIRVHSSCQRQYGDERAAAAVVRRSLSSDSSSSSQSSTPLPVLEEEEFDFKNSCFICTEKIPENILEMNQRVRLKQRIRISTVKSFSAVKKPLEPEEWGWLRTPRGLEPITMSLKPAPDNLLRSISCKCKTNCGKACGCRKDGLFCSVICTNCQENYCSNIANVIDDDDLDAIDEDDVCPDTVRAFNIHESLPSTSGA